MATEQAQFFCHNCRCPTLHTRITEDCPHLVHGIVTLFLCGLWFPIWLVHSLMVDSANGKQRFLCNRCGQPAGMVPMMPPPLYPPPVAIPVAQAVKPNPPAGSDPISG